MIAKTNINKVILIELQASFVEKNIKEHKVIYKNIDEITELKLPKNYGNDPYLKDQVGVFISDCEKADETNNDGEKSDKYNFYVVTLYGRKNSTITSFRINTKFYNNIVEDFNQLRNLCDLPSN